MFGHPKGLSILFLTEMWERMSYYGMRSRIPHEQFFLLMAAIGVAAGLALFAMNRPLDRIVGAHDRHEAGARQRPAR